MKGWKLEVEIECNLTRHLMPESTSKICLKYALNSNTRLPASPYAKKDDVRLFVRNSFSKKFIYRDTDLQIGHHFSRGPNRVAGVSKQTDGQTFAVLSTGVSPPLEIPLANQFKWFSCRCCNLLFGALALQNGDENSCIYICRDIFHCPRELVRILRLPEPV